MRGSGPREQRLPASNLGVVLSLFLKPLKCKTYFALFSTFFFFLIGFWCLFINILSWFSNGVYSLAISTDSGLLSLTFFGWEKGEVMGVSRPAPVHPASLVLGHQPESRTVHHQHHTVAHTDRQLSDKIPSDSELPTGLFVF